MAHRGTMSINRQSVGQLGELHLCGSVGILNSFRPAISTGLYNYLRLKGITNWHVVCGSDRTSDLYGGPTATRMALPRHLSRDYSPVASNPAAGLSLSHVLFAEGLDQNAQY